MRNLAVKAWVFRPDLLYRIVLVTGKDEEGDKCDVKGRVSDWMGDKIEVRSIYNSDVIYTFRLENFHEEGLKLEVWDTQPNVYSVPDEYWTESERNEMQR
ncbi:hypothetical protein [Paenibacillus aquistagni]|uniref:Uncharacterized protein n=1 Tax=Paenibacillus aquistagni TaxID=1852522 RepID=A0A1X7LWS7_9BACL|nr:hypothetical protein [Paenibacillus aquistagni]SMG58285.1 hypothetical protein SAMN06295960_4664 [Paenibacillus aquistagni]